MPQVLYDVSNCNPYVVAHRYLTLSFSSMEPTINVRRVRDMCSFCGRIHSEGSRLMKCGKCKHVMYCDEVCQKLDWDGHDGHTGHRLVCARGACDRQRDMIDIMTGAGFMQQIREGATEVGFPTRSSFLDREADAQPEHSFVLRMKFVCVENPDPITASLKRWVLEKRGCIETHQAMGHDAANRSAAHCPIMNVQVVVMSPKANTDALRSSDDYIESRAVHPFQLSHIYPG